MPKFSIPITRDVTVTAQVDVIAESPAQAVLLAEQLARAASGQLTWELDDCMGGEPYFAGDVEEIG